MGIIDWLLILALVVMLPLSWQRHRKRTHELHALVEEQGSVFRELLSSLPVEREAVRQRGQTGKEIEEVAFPRFVSVQQAHDAAVELRLSRNIEAGRTALQQIVDRGLLGDPDDFHNAHVEATRLADVELALNIIESGLHSFPDYYDLMADKASALVSVGRALEARKMLEEWRNRQPQEFTRGWRPASFYIAAVQAMPLTEEVRSLALAILQQATEAQRYEEKLWSTHARFLRDLGDFEGARKILEQGLKYNPLSQELNYVLGELFLAQGNQEAVRFLENALRYDYQEQYQHNVNQYAIRCTLAQAYEMVADRQDDAERLYQSIIDAEDLEASYYMRIYSRNRLEAIRLRSGRPLRVPTSPANEGQGLEEVVDRILAQMARYFAVRSTAMMTGSIKAPEAPLSFEYRQALEQAVQGFLARKP